MHVRAAKIIFKFDWNTSSAEVISKSNWKSLLVQISFVFCLFVFCFSGFFCFLFFCFFFAFSFFFQS